jgi:hypothetical protein
LNEDFQLRVVIDGSPGALEPMLFQTGCQELIEVGMMDRTMIEKLPQFQTLFAFVSQFNLSDVVWNVLGGVPRKYNGLNKSITRALDADPSTVQSAIGEYLCSQVSEAIRIVNEAKINSDIDQILELVDEDFRIPASELVPRKLKRPTPDKVLREVKVEGKWVLVPSTNAIGIVLRHQLTEEPTVEKLVALVSQ